MTKDIKVAKEVEKGANTTGKHSGWNCNRHFWTFPLLAVVSIFNTQAVQEIARIVFDASLGSEQTY